MAYTMEYPTKDLFHNLLVQIPLDDVCKNKQGNIPFSKNVMDVSILFHEFLHSNKTMSRQDVWASRFLY